MNIKLVCQHTFLNSTNLYCKSIKNFPLSLKYGGFTKEEIMIARKWVEEQKGKYEMNRDTF
jgi:hypothetical protein